MTQTEKDALLGRLVREEREAAKNYSFLSAKAADIGTTLEQAAEALKSNPARFFFEGQPCPSPFPSKVFKDSDFPSPEELKDLVTEIRKTSAEWSKIREQLAGMGHAPSH